MKFGIYSNVMDNGGISKYMINMKNALMKCGIESEIVVFEKKGDYIEKINILECRGHIERIKKLRNYLKRSEIDVFITNTWFETFIAKVSIIKLKKRIKLISVVHIRPDLWGISKKAYIKKFVAKVALRKADKVVAVSNDLRDALIEEKWVVKDRIVTIYNPVIFEENNNKKRTEKLKEISIKTKVEIAVIGWIQERKAQDVVIKALNEMRNKKVYLNFIGGVTDEEEEYFKYIKKLINEYDLSESVKFWGFKENALEILEKMDILISASRGEALPTVLIEALQKEIPIISSDCKYGPKEILSDGEFGILFEVDNYKELSKNIEILVNDNRLYNEFKKKSKKRSEVFGYKKSVEKYLDIIKEEVR